MSLRTLPLIVALIAPPLFGQSPRITPAGDPSLKSDTIYSLAVKPADYSDEPYVILLDDGVVKLEADGRSTRTYRQVIQILTQDAAEEWGEHTFSYSADREKLTVNWVRVLDTTGKVISAAPTHEQESLAPVSLDAPVYSDVTLHRVTLGGVAPGTLVDYSFTVETDKPIVPHDFLTSWSVQTGVFTRRSRFVVDVPESLTPHIIERHLPFARRTVMVKGRTVYTWATQEVPKPEPEPLAPDSSYGESIAIAAPRTWGEIANWYAGLSRDRYALTPAIEQKIADVVHGATTLDDSLRAVHRWVAQDFRYVSLSLGIGGYQPHMPASMYQNRYGDCKDKATFFIAVLRHLGVTAYPVLLSADGGIERALPSAYQFDHMIAAVQRPGGYTYVDLTADIVPYGLIPPSEEGEFGLVIHPDGRGEEVTFPYLSAASNLSTVELAGDLSPTGMFSGRWTRSATGAQQFSLRGSMSRATKLDSAERARATLSFANAIIDGAKGDSLTLFDGRDLNATPRISVLISDGKLANDAGGTQILTLPVRDFASRKVAAALQARGPRTTPIDMAKVWGLQKDVTDFRVTLPVGWHARLPGNILATSAFGTYSAQYVQEGRELHVTRSLAGTYGVQPADKMGDLIAWLDAISRDDVKYLVLEPPAAPH